MDLLRKFNVNKVEDSVGSARRISSKDIYHVSRIGSIRSSIAVDLPLVSLVRYTLYPLTVVALLFFTAKWYGESLSNNYIVLSILAFLLSLQVFGEASFYTALTSFPVFIALSSIIPRSIIFALILTFLGYTTGLFVHFSYPVLQQWLILVPFALLISQLLSVNIIYKIIKATKPSRRAVIVGVNQLSQELYRKINTDRFLNINVSGFFDDRDRVRQRLSDDGLKLGRLSELPSYANTHHIQIIYICLPIVAQPRIIKLLEELRDTTVSVYFVPDIFMVDLIQARIDRITGIPILAICETPFYGFRGMIKRMFDIALSLIILLLIWPVMFAVAVGVKLSSPGPIIFKQRRYGLDGQEIAVYKFRTMSVCEDGETITQAKRHDGRITAFGGFLRRTSLDELPQFLNVLGGSMSIVGPRPHAVAHNEMYRKVIKAYMIRHKVKPGITGWAQVNGFRGETATLDRMRGRVECDLDYLRNWSVTLDMWIMIKTALLVFGDQRAY